MMMGFVVWVILSILAGMVVGFGLFTRDLISHG